MSIRSRDTTLWCQELHRRSISFISLWEFCMKVLHIVGARPNFMKAAPVYRAFSAHVGVCQLMVHTGQHYDFNMSDVFFQQLAVPAPDVNLQVGSGSHAQQTGAIMIRIEPVLLEHCPDYTSWFTET